MAMGGTVFERQWKRHKYESQQLRSVYKQIEKALPEEQQSIQRLLDQNSVAGKQHHH